MPRTHLPPRPEAITAAFLKLAEEHIADLLAGRAEKLFHAKDFAARLFVHPRHLTNTIHDILGVSPCEIMEKRVVDETNRMLRETTMPIADIAYIWTYSEPTNFTKFYKNMTGETPMQYRKKQRAVAA
jgi:AraC family transcriptional regulator of adaptative response / methylphosphotriester-DNA alkyltransferase methyltransferase